MKAVARIGRTQDPYSIPSPLCSNIEGKVEVCGNPLFVRSIHYILIRNMDQGTFQTLLKQYPKVRSSEYIVRFRNEPTGSTRASVESTTPHTFSDGEGFWELLKSASGAAFQQEAGKFEAEFTKVWVAALSLLVFASSSLPGAL